MIDDFKFWLCSKLIDHLIRRRNFKQVEVLLERKKKIAINLRNKIKKNEKFT